MIMTISSSKINMYDEEIESDIFFYKMKTHYFF